MNEALIKKYAMLAVKQGVNIQKGQLLVINCPVDGAYFARACSEAAYELGAKRVIVKYNDELLTKQDLTYADSAVLKDIKPWEVARKQAEIDEKCAYLHIISCVPDVLKGIDPMKMQEVMIAQQTAFKPFRNYTSANHGQWSIVAIANPVWAKKVFPDLNEDEAVKTLWEAILKTVHIDETNDVLQVWENHCATIKKHYQSLNEYNFKSLHFSNSLGTDLTVELIKDHIWAGGSEMSTSNVEFNPNMPTEEVFTMPLKTGVHGTVVSTKPLNYQGKLIESFSLTFKEGKVVAYQSETNQEALKNLVEFDEGSAYLGEVALISHDSPISKSGILFYDTLFDENASCHLALGSAYPMNVKNGVNLSEEELSKIGANVSMTHVDFMFGSADMHIVGTCFDGTEVEVFKDGNFVI